MHVRFSNSAEADLDQIHDYIAARNKQAAIRVVVAITSLCDQLGNFPFLGREGRVEGTREISVPRTPYFIVYVISDEYHLDIEAIIHERLQYPEEDSGY